MPKSGNSDRRHRIAILASGRGSNARAILDYFRESELGEVVLVVSNQAEAGVLNVAKEYGVSSLVTTRIEFLNPDGLARVLREKEIGWIVLAGFLWLIPPHVIAQFPKRILNIHPALLPKYGGKGMYGMFVHEAVKKSGDSESGITIHFIDEEYDRGPHLFQARCPLDPGDSPGDIASKVLLLEHFHYPRVIESLLLKANN